jgi:carboxylate-amine ligase
MPEPNPLHLFEAFGIEAEYMIVRQDNLNVAPEAEKLLQLGDQIQNEVSYGSVNWSNELASHVIEIKTNGPRANLEGLDQDFSDSLAKMKEILKPHGLTLMGTAMHPWMKPAEEYVLWPHENHEIYNLYDSIFHCKGHGWSNLQSIHINLPFGDESEFVQLHSAIRLILPLIPAIAGSSPIFESKLSSYMDSRMIFYSENQKKIPEITGLVIPEHINSIHEYFENILNPMYQAIRKFDPESILQEEWLNSRGAIARFERNAIEIRVTDIQENPKADLGIIKSVIWQVRRLIESGLWKESENFSSGELREILDQGIKQGSKAIVSNTRYTKLFESTEARNSEENSKSSSLEKEIKALDLFTMYGKNPATNPDQYKIWREKGNLGERIRNRLGEFGPGEPIPRERLFPVYQEIHDCLSGGKYFL